VRCGSCFSPTFETACAELGAEYRHTCPYTPQTNGMVEHFSGRIIIENAKDVSQPAGLLS
jgi:transposase InsO family protein